MLPGILCRLKTSLRLFSTNVAAVTQSDPTAPRQLLYPSKYIKPRQIWLESLDTIDEKKLAILELHPDIFAQSPRIDLIHQNVQWQRMYRLV